jgi:hypothetical protein
LKEWDCVIVENHKHVGDAFVIKHKNDQDYYQDSFEDFLDSAGVVQWIESSRL